MAFLNVAETKQVRFQRQRISEQNCEQAIIKRSTSRLAEAATLIENAAYDLAKTNKVKCTATLLLQSAAIERLFTDLSSELDC